MKIVIFSTFSNNRIIYGICTYSRSDIVNTKQVKESKLTPLMRHITIHRTMAHTMGSQFPRVPMVKVNGLKSHVIREGIHKLSGTPRSFKIVWINEPTSKSAT